MQANPTKVARNGNLIIVGDTLTLPQISIEDGGGVGGGEEPVVPECDPAVEPRGECTEYGNFVIYPDAYCGPLPPKGVTPAPSEEHIREHELAPLLAEREAAAVTGRIAAVKSINDLLEYGAFDWAITDAEATKRPQPAWWSSHHAAADRGCFDQR